MNKIAPQHARNPKAVPSVSAPMHITKPIEESLAVTNEVIESSVEDVQPNRTSTKKKGGSRNKRSQTRKKPEPKPEPKVEDKPEEVVVTDVIETESVEDVSRQEPEVAESPGPELPD